MILFLSILPEGADPTFAVILGLVAAVVFGLMLVIGARMPMLLLAGAILADRLVYEAILISGWQLPGAILSQTALRVSAALSGVFIVALFAVVLLRAGSVSRLDLVLAAYFVGWNLFATVNGWLRGNATVYLVGDFYNALQVWLLYYCVVRLTRHDVSKLVTVWSIYLVIALLVELRYLVGYAELLQVGELRRIGGGNHLLGLLCFAFLLGGVRGWRRPVTAGTFLVAAVVVLLAAYRAKWALLTVGLIMMAVWWPQRAQLLRRLGPAMATTVLTLTVVFAMKFDTLVPALRKRVMEETITRYQEGDLDMSTMQKLYEMKRVNEEIRREPTGGLIGFGNGAEFDLDETALPHVRQRWEERGSLHNIHNTYYALLFRQGIVGLGLFLGLCGLMLGRAVRATIGWLAVNRDASPAQRDEAGMMAALAMCAAVFMALAFFGFTQAFYLTVYSGHTEWGLLFATIAVADARLREKRAATAT